MADLVVLLCRVAAAGGAACASVPIGPASAVLEVVVVATALSSR